MQNRVVWRIKRKNPLRCLTCTCVEEKKAYINKNFAYISPICREAPLGGICIKFCTTGPLADIINHAKFLSQSVRGFWFCWGIFTCTFCLWWLRSCFRLSLQRYSSSASAGDNVNLGSDLSYQDFWPVCDNPEQPDLRLVHFESFE